MRPRDFVVQDIAFRPFLNVRRTLEVRPLAVDKEHEADEVPKLKSRLLALTQAFRALAPIRVDLATTSEFESHPRY